MFLRGQARKACSVIFVVSYCDPHHLRKGKKRKRKFAGSQVPVLGSPKLGHPPITLQTLSALFCVTAAVTLPPPQTPRGLRLLPSDLSTAGYLCPWISRSKFCFNVPVYSRIALEVALYVYHLLRSKLFSQSLAYRVRRKHDLTGIVTTTGSYKATPKKRNLRHR